VIPLPKIPRAALGPIAIASLLVLMAWLFSSVRPPPQRFAPVGAVPLAEGGGRAPAAPAPLSGNYNSRGGQDLVITSAGGLFDEQEQARLRADIERALGYVVTRFGSAPLGPISAYLGLEPTCGLHGIAYTDVRTVQVFTCRDLPTSRVVSIAAHELVHQLCHDRYGEAHMRADLVLMEGVATWGAGAYWLGEAPSFRAFVRPWLARGEELPLGISYVGRSISDMNKLYYQWASFVEFLIEHEGRERFDALYVSGASAPASADYLGIYGRSFAELEAEWRAWVLGQ
jgi:hypothetical protein